MYNKINHQYVLLLLLIIGISKVASAQPGYFSTKILSNSYTETVEPADINQDGELDIILTNGKLYWYENDGDENFTKHVFESSFAFASALFIIDLDENGTMDVIAGGTQVTGFY